MPLGDAFQDSTDKALEVLASRPLDPEPPAPKHSAWSVIPRAMAAAGAEIGGNVMDIAGAYGQVAAATGVNDNPWDSVTGRNKEVTLSSLITGVPEDKHRKEQLALYEKLKTDGIDWRQEEGRQAYSFARDLRPDPQTAGTAEQITFGLTKGLTKAIGSAVVLGPVGGATTFGTSEGMTTAEDLAVQGVDQATRTKVGAVTGVVTAAGMALPVAGQTLKQTAALVAVGGPGSFIAQQAASRAILENADYAEQAQQFDPLDPTGLALATLLPAGFAAYAKRGGFAKSVKPGEPPKITPDEADAVMVHNLTAAADDAEANPPAKMAADLWRSDVTQNENFRAWFGGSKVVDADGKPLVVYHGTVGDFSVFDPGRAGQEKYSDWGPGVYFTPSPRNADYYRGEAAKQIDTESARLWELMEAEEKKTTWANGSPTYTEEHGRLMKEWREARATAEDRAGSIIPAYLSIKNPLIQEYTNMPDPYLAARAQEVGHDGILVLKSDGSIDEIVAFRPEQIKSAIGNSGKFDPNSGSLTDRQEAQPMSLTDSELNAQKGGDPFGQEGQGRRQEVLTDRPADQSPADPRLEAIKAEQPDLPVRVSDDGTPIRLADELEAAKKLAQEGADDSLGLNDAPLLKVAAECFLSLGATAG